jgi:undecaprenyl-diphosphatase
MMDFLLRLDITIFFFINHGLQNGFLDWLMPIFTNPRNWFPLFGLVYVWLWWKGGKTGRTAAVLIIPVILLSDQLSSAVLKPLVQRLRPCVVLEGVNAITGINTSYSFPSSHATNAFAAAVFFSHYYPQNRWSLLFLALLSGFSRIYLGVHYPSDVAAGAALGALCAVFVIQAYDLTAQKFEQHRLQFGKAPSQPAWH